MPLVSLVCKHAEVGITDKIDHVISRANVETLAEPIDCQVTRCHGVKEEILQVLQGLGRGKESGFVHATIISTGFGDLGEMVDALLTGTLVCITKAPHGNLYFSRTNL